MHIYAIKPPKGNTLYDPKSGLLTPPSGDILIVNDSGVEKFMKHPCVYFLELGVLKTNKKLTINAAQVPIEKFSRMVSKLPKFDNKYKNLFIDKISKFVPVATAKEYLNNFSEAYQNITMVIFEGKPSVLCVSFVCHKKAFRASKFCPQIIYTGADLINRFVKAGYMTIDFSGVTSISKVNDLLKLVLQNICKDPVHIEQVKMHSQKMPKVSHSKKVRFSSRNYYNEQIPRPKPRKSPIKGILKNFKSKQLLR